MAKIGMIGAGSWGTALALLCDKNGHEVTIWSIMKDEVEMLRTKRQHETKLPGVILPEKIEITNDLKKAMTDKDVLVLAVPSAFTRSTARSMKAFLKPGQLIVNVAKGIEEHTMLTLSEIIEEELPEAEVAVMSGPSHAEEVGIGLPTNIVVSTHKESRGRVFAGDLHEPRLPCLHEPGYPGRGAGAVPLRTSLLWQQERRTVWATATTRKRL